jgi:hypothetical protein
MLTAFRLAKLFQIRRNTTIAMAATRLSTFINSKLLEACQIQTLEAWLRKAPKPGLVLEFSSGISAAFHIYTLLIFPSCPVWLSYTGLTFSPLLPPVL